MTVIDRRAFLTRAGLSTAALTALGGPLQGLFARGALAVGSTGVAPNNGGYGPIGPVPDHADGMVRLHLPEGFEYRSFNATGTPTTDGIVTPGRHDGMAAFGGAAPWGSWITAEETVNGPDVGPDFTGADNSLLRKRHGYIYEVPLRWGPGQHQMVKPIHAAGRFAHEAVDVDPETGILYQTEDNFCFPSGLYRYIAPRNPMQARQLTEGGRLEMLKVVGESNAPLHEGQEPGATYDVEWVSIDEPDKEFPEGTTNNQAIVFVGDQGRAKGAAIFSRLEGIFHDSGKIYLVSTQGGATPAGETPPAGFGDGFGQLWVYDTHASTLTLLFES